ncbi:MAG: family 78 glycoside hydrolase catalytic domain, partial [Prevotella sp.]|nr:family 78 glycoside hydrolase catalytic domain [Prevotella sp.]
MNRRLIIAIMALFSLTVAVAKPKAVRLVTENMENPLGLSTHTPRFSWQLTDAKKNTMQTAYRIMVASDPELLKEGKADLWDSGMVQSDASIWIDYAGKALKDNQRCFWTVQVKTNNGMTGWAEPQEFGIGLTADSHWTGRWVGIDRLLEGESLGYKTRVNARYLRGEIALDPGKTVKRATAYVGVLGYYQFYVNGERQGDEVLAPGQTDTRRSIIYNTFDITKSLVSSATTGGKACMGVILGNGRTVPPRYHKHYKIPFLGFPTCRMTIIVEYTDGTQKKFGSSEKWKITANGPIRSNNEYDGEVYDARKDLGKWSCVGYDDSSWQTAERATLPLGELHGQTAPNMTVAHHIKPVSIKKTGRGTFIVDFGQNMAGWVQMNMSGNAGDTIKIKY